MQIYDGFLALFYNFLSFFGSCKYINHHLNSIQQHNLGFFKMEIKTFQYTSSLIYTRWVVFTCDWVNWVTAQVGGQPARWMIETTEICLRRTRITLFQKNKSIKVN